MKKTSAIPWRHNKTIWYFLNAPGLKAKLLVLKFALKRYFNMIGFNFKLYDEFVVKINNLIIYSVPSWAELDAFNGVFIKKLYEPDLCFYPENNHIILDCGASIGIYTLKAALCGTTMVFAIEPNPLVFSRLTKNIKANNLANVISINKGIGSENKKAKLYWGETTLGGSIKPDVKSVQKKNEVEVEITTLDNIIEQYNLKMIDLIKLDVEGSEYDALTGATNTLMVTKKLVLEFHSEELKNKCESLLISRGFRKILEIPEHQFYINSSFD